MANETQLLDVKSMDPDWFDSEIKASQLARLLGRGSGAIIGWTAKGLRRNSNGNFNVRQAIHWYSSYIEKQKRQVIIPEKLSQEQIADLLDVARQTVASWSRAGLPQNSNKTYDLKRVCGWLRVYYASSAKREYQDRLETMRKKVARNAAQLQRFLDGAKLNK